MRLLSCLFLVLSTFLAVRAQGADPADYFQLKEGNEWSYDVVIASPKGEKVTRTGGLSCGGTQVRDGKTYFRVRSWIQNTLDGVMLMRQDAAGSYSLDPDDLNAKEQIDTPLPLKVGSTWERTYKGLKRASKIVGKETVTIGDKKYANCYHQRTTALDGTYTEDAWAAPGVGVVKSVVVHKTGATMTLTLREFSERR